ncbi:hypothetical protein ACHAW6_015653 [Cyclotella cf. meneghiniana]
MMPEGDRWKDEKRRCYIFFLYIETVDYNIHETDVAGVTHLPPTTPKPTASLRLFSPMSRTIKNGLFLLIGIQTTWTFHSTPGRTHRPRRRPVREIFDPVRRVSFFCDDNANRRDVVRDRRPSSRSARGGDRDFDPYNPSAEGIEREGILAFQDDGDDRDGNYEMITLDVDAVGGVGESGEVSKKLIECHASILLPFPADVAFDAFSDLTRQPSWCKYLESVEYVGFVGEAVHASPREVPLRQSKWTVGVKGLRFSWTARDTCIVRPHRIEWESTSGMKNRGSVEFTPHASHDSEHTTQMTLRFTFVTPRVVSSLFRRSTLIRRYTEDVLLMNMLTDFRDIVLEEDMR